MLTDLKYALSQLRRHTASTCAIISAMVVGMAVTSSIYAIVNGVLIRPFPCYTNQERLAVLWQASKDTPRFVVAPANFLDWKRQSSTFSDMAAIQQYRERTFAITGAGEPEEFDGVRVTSNIFNVLGVRPAEGRSFRPEEGQAGHNGVALLSDGLWHRKFGGAISAVGSHIVLNGRSTEIIGVLPKGFQLPLVKADIFAPTAWDAQEENERSVSNYLVIGRMKDGVSIEQARAELTAIASQLERAYPETNTGETVRIEPLYETVVGDIRPTLLTLMTAACLLLLLGSASVSNLLLARLSQRRNEIAIRASVGATPARLARQMIAETLVISSIAGIAGLVLARYAVSALLALAPESVYFSIPRRDEIGIDLNVFLFALATMVASGLLVGFGPAWVASKADLNSLLKEEGRGSAGRVQTYMRQVLMGTQIALAFLLIVGTGLMVKSSMKLHAVNPGFRADGILTAQVSLPVSRYPNDVRLSDFYRRLTQGLSSLPEIEAVSLVDHPPLGGVASMWSFEVVGQPPLPRSRWPAALHTVVAPNYFEALHIPLLRGRYLSADDGAGALPVVIVSQAFAQRFFKATDPVGKRLVISDGGVNPRQIVGVVGDVRSLTLVRRPMPQMYVPFEQLPQRAMTVMVRSSSGVGALAAAVRVQVARIDRDQPVAKIRPLRELVADASSRFAVATLLSLGFGLAASVISLISLYGMSAYATSRRIHEIGIRYALGATSTSLFQILIREALLIAAVGTATGLVLAWMLSHFLGTILFEVRPHDPFVFGLASAAVLLACALCAMIAVVRVVPAEPMEALRGGATAGES